jgi:hypothetical protein
MKQEKQLKEIIKKIWATIPLLYLNQIILAEQQKQIVKKIITA